MNKHDKYDIIMAAAKYSGTAPMTWEQFQLFQRFGILERKHKRLCEENCNGTITDEKYEAQDAALKKRAAAIAGQLGLTMKSQGDPRGITLRLVKDNDSMGDYDYFALSTR